MNILLLTGYDQFIQMFGDITLGTVFTLILAIVFCVFCYRKIKEYFAKKVKEDEERAEQLQEALDGVRKFPEYRKQSLQIQKQMNDEFKEIHATLKSILDRLDKTEQESHERELNNLRDKLIERYRYYTSDEHNCTHGWTRMESDSFWQIFKDYEKLGGNGYMHTTVQPEMLGLEIIEMDDEERLTTLMKSRK